MNRFLSPALPASINSPRAAAIPPAQILSPNNPPHQAAAPPPLSSPYPMPTPSIPALRFPARASTAKTKAHPAPAAPHPAKPGPAAPAATLRAPPPPNPLRLRDISLPTRAAIRISPPAHHPQSISSSLHLLSERDPYHEPSTAPVLQ